MNPSASGWIKKLLTTLPNSSIIEMDKHAFYRELKRSGFIYGSNVSCICSSFNAKDYNEEERSKINLMTASYYIFKNENSSEDSGPKKPKVS